MPGLDFQTAFDFSGQTAIVTGATGGIGRAITAIFRERGIRVALVDRDPAVQALAAETGGGAMGLVCDIASEAEVDRTVAAAAEAFGGRIDILVNNAAIALGGPAETMPVADWDAVIAVDLRGQFLFSRAVAPLMLQNGYGRVVFLSSQAAVIGIKDHVAYSAAKAGVTGMARVMALEWAPRGITVNCVLPTVVDTAMSREGWSGERGERARAEIPCRRFAQPEEIALGVLFLTSGGAAMINGATLLIDGGFTIR